MKNNKQTDQLASIIAAKIIVVKSGLASALNSRFNSYSQRKQKWLFAASCGVGLCALIISLLLSFGSVPGTAAQSTDSLTLKHQANGKSTTNRQQPGAQ